jgi:hypothetical protein
VPLETREKVGSACLFQPPHSTVHCEIERDGALVIDQVVDGEVARGDVVGNQRIAVEGQCGLGGGEHAAEILFLFIHHFLNFLTDHRVR